MKYDEHSSPKQNTHIPTFEVFQSKRFKYPDELGYSDHFIDILLIDMGAWLIQAA